MAGGNRSHSEEVGAAAADGGQVQRHATQRRQMQVGGRGRRRGLRPARRGSAAGQAPAERLVMTADEAVGLLIQWMRDPEVPHGVRAKIAEDIADRAGLGSTQVIKVVGTEDDPIMRFFRDALNDPTALEAAPPPATHQPAIEAYAIGPPTTRRRARGDLRGGAGRARRRAGRRHTAADRGDDQGRRVRSEAGGVNQRLRVHMVR